MVVKQCLNCGAEFKTYKAWLRKSPGAGKFCSRKCNYLAKSDDGLTASQRCYRRHHEERRAHARAKYQKNKEQEKERHRRYAEANRERMNEYARRRTLQPKVQAQRAAKRKNDLQHRLREALRRRLWSAVRGKVKGGSAVHDLGCSIPDLKAYLEERFLPGMTWDNWGKVWHIDHKIALALVDLTVSQNVKRVCHYTNLQPLFVSDHHAKTRLDRAAARKIG